VSRRPSQAVEFGPQSSPFSLDTEPAYGHWRAHKLRRIPQALEAQTVPVARLERLSGAELDKLTEACRRANFAVYQTDPRAAPSMEALRAFGEQLGLTRFDHHLWASDNGIAALRKEAGGARANYIPYTDRPMNWHTDGYYNEADAAVRGVIMHCVKPAAEGGTNWLLDPEMVYIAMRDADPQLIRALMQCDAMTIPENTLEPGAHRGPVSGPVFSVGPDDGSLHMRYTARTRSIRWKNDAITRDAVAFLADLLTPPVPLAFRVSLKAGEGIVCNNVLHNREAFDDGPDSGQQRLLWRARYRDRVMGTDLFSFTA
jgi:hypothetical protein